MPARAIARIARTAAKAVQAEGRVMVVVCFGDLDLLMGGVDTLCDVTVLLLL